MFRVKEARERFASEICDCEGHAAFGHETTKYIPEKRKEVRAPLKIATNRSNKSDKRTLEEEGLDLGWKRRWRKKKRNLS